MAEPTRDPHRSETRPAATGSRGERRAAPRMPVAYVRCWSPAPASILNVSRSGLGIESFRPFKWGESVFLTSESGGRRHRIVGQVRWCRQIATAGGSGSPVYQVGIALARPLYEGWSALLEGKAAGEG